MLNTLKELQKINLQAEKPNLSATLQAIAALAAPAEEPQAQPKSPQTTTNAAESVKLL